MASPEFEAHFRELQKRFLARIPGDRETVPQLLARLGGAACDEEALRLLHRLAHNYSGGGRTFGFPLISEAALKLELRLRDMAGPECLPELKTLAGRLMEAFSAASAGGTLS